MELHVTKLTKQYRRGNRAIDDLSLDIGDGIFGLVGPNGAGKTTLMKMLVTLLEPTKGTVTYDGLLLGRDNQAIRRLLGYLPQDYGLYPALTALELLNYMAHLHGLPDDRKLRGRIGELLEQVNLSHVASERVGSFSGGMRQRLGIAQALINDPSVLIVDEPTAGLDPEERVRFRTLLAHLSRDRIVILSTHIIGDISSSCDDLAVLDRGQVAFRGRPVLLIEQARGFVWSVVVPPAGVPAIEAGHHVTSAVRRSAGVELRLLGEGGSVQNLPQLQPEEPTLEDAYIWLMSHRNSEAVQ